MVSPIAEFKNSEFRLNRCLENKWGPIKVAALINDVQETNLSIRMVLVMFLFAKVVRVNVSNDLTSGGDLLVHEDYAARNNATHPYQ